MQANPPGVAGRGFRERPHAVDARPDRRAEQALDAAAAERHLIRWKVGWIPREIGVEPDHRRGHERKAAADAVVAAVELAPLSRGEVHVRLKRLGLGG